jgi:molybdate transport system ATP-binding protein
MCWASSLLEAIAGIRTPDRGVLRVGDRTLFSSAERINVPARDRHIGYVPQDSLLFPNLDVRGNVTYGAGRAGGEFEALVAILDLQPILDRRVTMLSGGEKQRVAIARALMTRPSILLLDEPLAGVDRDRREVILPYILKIRQELHVPLVYVTHDEAELKSIADRVLRLKAGRIAPATPAGA